MAGTYQPANVVLALEGMSLLLKGHHASWSQALRHMRWPARMEEVKEGVILDGAHNMPAVKALAESVRARIDGMEKEGGSSFFFSTERKTLRRDDLVHMQEIPADLIIVTEVESARRVPKEELKEDFEKYTDKPVFTEDTSEKAWQRAMQEKREDDMVYCFGSLYLAGEIEALLRRSEYAEF